MLWLRLLCDNKVWKIWVCLTVILSENLSLELLSILKYFFSVNFGPSFEFLYPATNRFSKAKALAKAVSKDFWGELEHFFLSEGLDGFFFGLNINILMEKRGNSINIENPYLKLILEFGKTFQKKYIKNQEEFDDIIEQVNSYNSDQYTDETREVMLLLLERLQK